MEELKENNKHRPCDSGCGIVYPEVFMSAPDCLVHNPIEGEPQPMKKLIESK